jgi:hypothetical protein
MVQLREACWGSKVAEACISGTAEPFGCGELETVSRRLEPGTSYIKNGFQGVRLIKVQYIYR